MKTRGWMIACAMALFALTSVVAVAQDHGDKDQDKGQNRGEANKHYRQFNDNQRQAARQYYNKHQHEEVFQQNQWNNDYESRLRPGYVLDDDMRRMSRPAPDELTRGLGRPPHGYRYIVIGGHVILVDNGYRIHDTIHFEINLGH